MAITVDGESMDDLTAGEPVLDELACRLPSPTARHRSRARQAGCSAPAPAISTAESQTYAVEVEGVRFPVKQMLAQALQVPLDHGGAAPPVNGGTACSLRLGAIGRTHNMLWLKGGLTTRYCGRRVVPHTGFPANRLLRLSQVQKRLPRDV